MSRYETDTKIMELWCAGRSGAEIGLLLELSLTYVDYRIRRLRAQGHDLPARVKSMNAPPRGAKVVRGSEKKPPKTDESGERRCLRCQRYFLSEWMGNRLCDQCSKSQVYSSVVSGY